MQAQLREANVQNAQRQWEMASIQGAPGIMPLQGLGYVGPTREQAFALQTFSPDAEQGNWGVHEHVSTPVRWPTDDHRAADTTQFNAAHQQHATEVESNVHDLADCYGMADNDRSDSCSVGHDAFPMFGLARAIARKIQL
jgi:hypothetical protein